MSTDSPGVEDMKRLSGTRGFTLIELMVVVAVAGILASIAIPNLLRFRARTRQAEVRANLRALFTAQRAFYTEHGRYSPLIREIGFAPQRGNRYAYQVGYGTAEDRGQLPAVSGMEDTAVTVDTARFTGAEPIPSSYGVEIDWEPPTGVDPPGVAPGGVQGECPTCEFSAFAAGNIDNELLGIDSWYIGSVDSVVQPMGHTEPVNVPAGTAQFTYNDVDHDQ